MAQIKQHKIDIFMRIELQFQKCNFSPISIKSLGICGFLLVTRSLCFLNVSVIVFFVFVFVIVFLLDMSSPIIALISQGSLGVFFGSVFKSVGGKVISRAVLRGPAKNIPPQLEQLQVPGTLYNLSSVSFLTIVGWCLHHISTGSRQAGIDLSDICS